MGNERQSEREMENLEKGLKRSEMREGERGMENCEKGLKDLKKLSNSDLLGAAAMQHLTSKVAPISPFLF